MDKIKVFIGDVKLFIDELKTIPKDRWIQLSPFIGLILAVLIGIIGGISYMFSSDHNKPVVSEKIEGGNIDNIAEVSTGALVQEPTTSKPEVKESKELDETAKTYVTSSLGINIRSFHLFNPEKYTKSSEIEEQTRKDLDSINSNEKYKRYYDSILTPTSFTGALFPEMPPIEIIEKIGNIQASKSGIETAKEKENFTVKVEELRKKYQDAFIGYTTSTGTLESFVNFYNKYGSTYGRTVQTDTVFSINEEITKDILSNFSEKSVVSLSITQGTAESKEWGGYYLVNKSVNIGDKVIKSFYIDVNSFRQLKKGSELDYRNFYFSIVGGTEEDPIAMYLGGYDMDMDIYSSMSKRLVTYGNERVYGMFLKEFDFSRNIVLKKAINSILSLSTGKNVLSNSPFEPLNSGEAKELIRNLF